MKFLILILLIILPIGMIAPREAVAQGCDANGNGSLNVTDLTYLVAYLYGDGPAPPDYDAADMDDYRIITLNDVRVLESYIKGYVPEPQCPPVFGPRPQALNPYNWLELEEDVFPAEEQVLTLHFRLTTDREIVCLNFPVSITVGVFDPQIDQIRYLLGLNEWYDGGGALTRDDGKVMFCAYNDAGEGLPPQDNVLIAEVDISLPEPAADPLPIIIEWDLEAPPEGPYGRSHYPFLLELPAKQADTAWIPELKGNPPYVPTITGWGLVVLLGLLLGSGMWVIICRRRAVAARI